MKLTMTLKKVQTLRNEGAPYKDGIAKLCSQVRSSKLKNPVSYLSPIRGARLSHWRSLGSGFSKANPDARLYLYF